MARKIEKPTGVPPCLKPAVEWLKALGCKFREPRWEDRHIMIRHEMEDGYVVSFVLRCDNEKDFFLSSPIFGVKPRYFTKQEQLKRMIDHPFVP